MKHGANERPGVDAGWRVLFTFEHLRPRATQAGRSAVSHAMNQKPILASVIAACAIAAICILGGCRLRPGNGTIYYEAKSAAAVTALRSRIEPLRTALRGNSNFTEVSGREILMFRGTTNGPFADCFISFDRDEKDGARDHQAVLVVATARTFGVSKQVRELRKMVDESLGPGVVKLLTVNFDEKLIDVR